MFEEKISYRFFKKTKVHSASFTLFIISELNFKIEKYKPFLFKFGLKHNFWCSQQKILLKFSWWLFSPLQNCLNIFCFLPTKSKEREMIFINIATLEIEKKKKAVKLESESSLLDCQLEKYDKWP